MLEETVHSMYVIVAAGYVPEGSRQSARVAASIGQEEEEGFRSGMAPNGMNTHTTVERLIELAKISPKGKDTVVVDIM